MAVVYKGRVFTVEVERKRFPNGTEHEVAIVRHPPSVVLVPIQDDGRVFAVVGPALVPMNSSFGRIWSARMGVSRARALFPARASPASTARA